MELNPEQLEELWIEWKTSPALHTEFRFGQFVCNRLLPTGMTCPKLYFTDTGDAVYLLNQHVTGKNLLPINEASRNVQDFV